MINLNGVPILFAEGDTPSQRVQKLNDLVNQLVNAVTEMTIEIERLQKKIKQMEE
jgi:TolA-binding protein